MMLLAPEVWSGKILVEKWTSGAAGSRAVVEPATGGQLGEIGMASTEDVVRASARAAAAQREWAVAPPAVRGAVLRRAGELFEQYAEEIQDWLIREAGSIRPKAGLETDIAAAECFEASGLPTHPMGQVLPSGEPHWSFSRRRPAGVVSVIAPFNFPLILSIRSVAPALALGNAVLLKPDPRTAVSGGVVLARIFQEAGLPDGLLSLLPGGPDVGEALVTAPEVSIVSFTGSTRAGRAVGRTASEHLKRVHLELGGNNALIVLPGADLPKAASAGAFGSFNHQGQICMTTGRHLIHESLYDDYVALLADKATNLPIGNPAKENVALGPIIDAAQRDRIHDLVTRTVEAGANLSAGGRFEDLFYRPTVLSAVTPDMPAYAEEVFGPVAPVLSFGSLDDAIKLAADSPYGLSLGILGDVGLAMTVADAVPAGIVHINEQTVGDEAQVPFGGVRTSGTGSRFGGAEANIEAFTDTQWLTVRPDIAPYPF
ncbi:benzaldehyde dehydrogenase [Kribbella sp. NPDC051952]|uniref:benzaldehyde dehydrogenase n=1 Tax=Kribbella sp. NPDC051952 TaxID=3154851 RepID=UPI0034422229